MCTWCVSANISFDLSFMWQVNGLEGREVSVLSRASAALALLQALECAADAQSIKRGRPQAVTRSVAPTAAETKKKAAYEGNDENDLILAASGQNAKICEFWHEGRTTKAKTEESDRAAVSQFCEKNNAMRRYIMECRSNREDHPIVTVVSDRIRRQAREAAANHSTIQSDKSPWPDDKSRDLRMYTGAPDNLPECLTVQEQKQKENAQSVEKYEKESIRTPVAIKKDPKPIVQRNAMPGRPFAVESINSQNSLPLLNMHRDTAVSMSESGATMNFSGPPMPPCSKLDELPLVSLYMDGGSQVFPLDIGGGHYPAHRHDASRATRTAAPQPVEAGAASLSSPQDDFPLVNTTGEVLSSTRSPRSPTFPVVLRSVLRSALRSASMPLATQHATTESPLLLAIPAPILLTRLLTSPKEIYPPTMGATRAPNPTPVLLNSATPRSTSATPRSARATPRQLLDQHSGNETTNLPASTNEHVQATKMQEEVEDMCDEDLAAGWEMKYDSKKGKHYYINGEMQALSWVHPTNSILSLVHQILPFKSGGPDLVLNVSGIPAPVECNETESIASYREYEVMDYPANVSFASPQMMPIALTQISILKRDQQKVLSYGLQMTYSPPSEGGSIFDFGESQFEDAERQEDAENSQHNISESFHLSLEAEVEKELRRQLHEAMGEDARQKKQQKDFVETLLNVDLDRITAEGLALKC